MVLLKIRELPGAHNASIHILAPTGEGTWRVAPPSLDLADLAYAYA